MEILVEERGFIMAKAYLVNTNRSNNESCEIEMLNDIKCSAYYSPWKFYIDQIEANDVVFLYRSGTGIIARGIATGIPEVKAWEGNIDEEHFMNLNRFEVLKQPLPASEITKMVGHDLVYHQTVISITHNEGICIWQYISKHCIK